MGKIFQFPLNRVQQVVTESPAPQVTPAGLHGYYPEMGDKKPACQMEARLTFGKWWVKTPLQLKGRGITFIQTYKPNDLVPQAQHKVGWHVYEVTPKAMEKLRTLYSIAAEFLLD